MLGTSHRGRPRLRFGLVSVVSGSDLLSTGNVLACASGWYLSFRVVIC
jgi:hypothetical protein